MNHSLSPVRGGVVCVNVRRHWQRPREKTLNGLCISILATSLATMHLTVFHERSEACQRTGPVVVAHTCQIAVHIVRATAIEYVQSPSDPDVRTTGIPDSKVAFRVDEVLKGDSLTGLIVLHGYLNDKDDFNDHPVPYRIVRRGGRAGSCFANTYKQGAEFLLFLKRTADGFTVNIDPLAPVNEQLHSSDDPWVYYIKGLIEGLKQLNKPQKSN